MEEITDRLREYAREHYGSLTAFALALDMSPQNLNDYLSGKAKPGNKLQQKLRVLGADVEYIMTGRRKESERPLQYGRVVYPIVSHIWAGQGGTEQLYVFDSRKTMEGPSDTKYKGCMYFQVRGDSMTPRWDEGDYVLVNPNKKPKHGEFGVVCWSNEEGALKKIFYHGENIVLQSLNINYPATTIEKEEIWFIGKVVSTLHR